jgi:isopenicillin N synthase-like dioxygenase
MNTTTLMDDQLARKPSRGMSAQRLPVVDMHPFLYGDEAGRQQVAGEIAQASQRYGFFYLTNHGIPQEVVAAGFDAARRFFDLPLEQRMACRPTQARQNRGYQPMYDTAAAGKEPDIKESFDMGFPLPADDEDLRAGLPFHSSNQWPQHLPGFRAQVEALYFAQLACGHQVLRAMAMALGVDANFFVARCVKPTTNMRLVHYPPQLVETDKGIGARAHADKGVITLLLNDENGGLHVLSADDEWIDAPPRQDAIIVNVGDLMTRWTNGRFRSAMHRVINVSGHRRYAIPQFHHPAYRTRVDPDQLPHGGPARFEPVVAGEYVAQGFQRDRKSWAP